MSKIKESVMVGVANESSMSVSRDEVKTWEPKKITILGSSVFFEHDGRFVSLDRTIFKDIFGDKFNKYK